MLKVNWRSRRLRRYIGRRVPGEAVFGIELRRPDTTARGQQAAVDATAAYHQTQRQLHARRRGRAHARQN